MIADTVLGCSPDERARSARDSGACRRMKLSAIRRLISRRGAAGRELEVGEVDLTHGAIHLCPEAMSGL
jgi:hypothetical protein